MVRRGALTVVGGELGALGHVFGALHGGTSAGQRDEVSELGSKMARLRGVRWGVSLLVELEGHTQAAQTTAMRSRGW